MASIERRSNNSVRIIVSCGYDSKGKKIVKKKTFKLPENLSPQKREKEIQKLAVMFEEEVRRGTYLDGNKLTFEEFIELWLKKYAEVELEPKTVAGYKGLMDRIIPALGHLKLTGIQPTHIIDFYNNLREKGLMADTKYKALPELKAYVEDNKIDLECLSADTGVSIRTIKSILSGKSTNKADVICKTLRIKLDSFFVSTGEIKPLSDNTILHYHRLLSSMLNDAVEWQLILSNPVDRVPSPKVKDKETAYYEEDTIERMLVLLENEPLKYRVMVSLAVFTGLRRGEICGLEWSDVDFENRKLRVRKVAQYVSGIGSFTKGTKNKTSMRTITLPDIAVQMLKEYKAKQNVERLEMGDLWQDSNRLFVQADGSPMHVDTISKWFTT